MPSLSRWCILSLELGRVLLRAWCAGACRGGCCELDACELDALLGGSTCGVVAKPWDVASRTGPCTSLCQKSRSVTAAANTHSQGKAAS
eukprot:5577014-Amphidinium_carterae.1